MNENINHTDLLVAIRRRADRESAELRWATKRADELNRQLEAADNFMEHAIECTPEFIGVCDMVQRGELPSRAVGQTPADNRERDALQRFRNDLRAALGSGEGMEHEVRAERQGDERDQRPIGDGEIPGPGSWSHGKGKWGLY